MLQHKIFSYVDTFCSIQLALYTFFGSFCSICWVICLHFVVPSVPRFKPSIHTAKAYIFFCRRTTNMQQQTQAHMQSNGMTHYGNQMQLYATGTYKILCCENKSLTSPRCIQQETIFTKQLKSRSIMAYMVRHVF